VILNELGRFDEAQSDFAQARELDKRPGDPFPSDLGNQLAVGHAKLGDLYLQAERADEAVEQYRKALEVRPSFVDIRSRLAQAYLMLGEPERAVDELNETLEMHPSFLAARIALGTALHRMERTEEAISEWRRCLEIDPGNRRARAYLTSVGIRIQEVAVPEHDAAAGGGIAG
jgi:tetratricopeptide (TPR) repeat protein